MKRAVFIALREMRHEWLASLCFIGALVGGLAPLLLILALKNGVLDRMVNGLVEDPRNRELIVIGTGLYEDAFFTELASQNGVGFVSPATRSINAMANGVQNPTARLLEKAVPLIPSGSGDPLSGVAADIAPGQTVLSFALASALQVKAGQSVRMLIGREISGVRETARADLHVLSVMEPNRYERPLLLLSLQDMVAVERFRDDASIQVDEWRDPRPLPDHFASFRIFAQDLKDVAQLQDYLKQQGIEVRPRASNIRLLLGFRENLSFLYATIAVLAVIGFGAAMVANLRGMVERQRISFSLLALIGMPLAARRMVPLVQSVTLVFVGITLTLLVVLGMVFAVNAAFLSSSGYRIAHLSLGNVVAALTVGLVLSGLSAIWAIRAIDGIGADEVLRDG